MICSIEGCGKGGKLIRGWCTKHYNRWWFHGDPNFMLRRGREQSATERFWSKVEQVGDCWLWMAAKNRGGYGRFRVRPDLAVSAHRFAYEELREEIPEGLVIDHLCRVRHCVNPWHLEPVPLAVNTARGERHARKEPA